MIPEKIFTIDDKSLELFAAKGTRNNKPRIDNPNAYKVRRVMQIISDLSKKPFEELSILDMACGEGVYSIEAALHGAFSVAIDARGERLWEGANAARRIGLTDKQIIFEQSDVRKIIPGYGGHVDVILFLGILYHLDKEDVFPVLKNIYAICREFVVIDTHIALQGNVTVCYNNKLYEGTSYQEHGETDPMEVRQKKLLASIDNPKSFWFTKESLLRLLSNIGFSSVYECYVPFEAGKPIDRITLVAVKGEPILISSYPWVNTNREEGTK